MKITIDVSEKNEGTNAPWWIIIDPFNLSNVYRNDTKELLSVMDIAFAISGPFFSRESAQNYLDQNHYNFSEHARVYCKSGYHNKTYANAYNNEESGLK